MRAHIKKSILAVLVAVCVFSMGFNAFRLREDSSTLRLAFWGTNLPYYNALVDVANMYNERQDNYKVEVQRQDAGNYRIWMGSQLAGGTAPEILATTNVYANADARNGYLYDFSEALSEPNPYGDDETAWRDTFAGTYLSQLEDPNQKGLFTSIPTSTVSVRIVINMEMLEKKRDALEAKGIKIDTDLNENWTFSQFRKICEVFEEDPKIKTAMEIANQQYINYHVSWMLDIFMGQVKYDAITDWDVSGNGLVEAEEICKMILDDSVGQDFSSDPDFREVLTFMRYWSRYWGASFNSRSDTSENFLRQRIPMMFCGSWGVAGIEMTLGNKNPDAPTPYDMFEYKSLPFPRLTKQTYVDDAPDGTFTFTNLKEDLPLQELGEPSGCFCIPLSAQKKGKLDGAVDFLRFFTSPEIAAYMANAAYEIPVIKGVKVNEIMNDFLPPARSETVRMRFGLQMLSSGTAEEFHFKRLQMYLSDKEPISLNELCNDVQKKYVEVTSQLAEDNEWYW